MPTQISPLTVRLRALLQALALVLLLGGLAAATGCRRVDANQVVADAQALIAAGDIESYEKAATMLAPMLKVANAPHSVKDQYVICLIRSEQTEKALVVAEELARLQPEDYMINYLVGKLYYDQQKYDKALPYLKVATNLAADFAPDFHHALVLTAFCAGHENDRQAGVYFEQLAATVADTPLSASQVYNEWGMWLAQMGRNDDALNVLSQARRLENYDPVISLNMAVVFERRGLPKVASKYYIEYRVAIQDSRPDRSRAIQQHMRNLPK